MNIKIHTHQLDMSDPLRNYAERHIADVVSHIFKTQAATLDIEFSDAVGGREKVCKVSLFAPHSHPLVASAQDPNPYAAVDLAAEKIGREVRRLKEKRLQAARHGVDPSQLPLRDDDTGEDVGDFEPAEEEAPRGRGAYGRHGSL